MVHTLHTLEIHKAKRLNHEKEIQYSTKWGVHSCRVTKFKMVSIRFEGEFCLMVCYLSTTVRMWWTTKRKLWIRFYGYDEATNEKLSWCKQKHFWIQHLGLKDRTGSQHRSTGRKMSSMEAWRIRKEEKDDPSRRFGLEGKMGNLISHALHLFFITFTAVEGQGRACSAACGPGRVKAHSGSRMDTTVEKEAEVSADWVCWWYSKKEKREFGVREEIWKAWWVEKLPFHHHWSYAQPK